MQTPKRAVVGLLLLLPGAVALVFLGDGVQGCLGPLGVTVVQCAKATGVVQGVGIGLPTLLLTVAAAVVVVAPPSGGRGLWMAIGALAGGATSAAAYLVMRPRTMEGLDSTGAWLSIPRPLDAAALVSAMLAGAVVGWVIARLVLARRRRTTATT